MSLFSIMKSQGVNFYKLLFEKNYFIFTNFVVLWEGSGFLDGFSLAITIMAMVTCTGKIKKIMLRCGYLQILQSIEVLAKISSKKR